MILASIKVILAENEVNGDAAENLEKEGKSFIELQKSFNFVSITSCRIFSNPGAVLRYPVLMKIAFGLDEVTVRVTVTLA